METHSQIADPAASNRLNNFNLLRLVFALMVILSHSTEVIDGDRHREPLTRLFGTSQSAGSLAVTGFFLLSGYLIVKSWDRFPRPVPYLAKRVLRIYPGFIVASLATAFVFPAMVVDSMSAYLHEIDPLQYGATLIFLLAPTLPQFFPAPHPDPNGPMWTIAYEFRCYLIVAILGMCGVIRRRKIWLAFAVAIVLTSFAPPFSDGDWSLAVRLASGEPNELLVFAAAFFVGGLFYLFREAILLRDRYAAMALILFVVSLAWEQTYPLGRLTAGAYLLFWFGGRNIRWLRPLRRLPDVSYGLYLYGWPVQKVLVFGMPGISPWTLFVAASGIGAAIGYVSWTYIERPFLRLKPRPRTPPI